MSMVLNPSTASALVPKVLSSRFHATTRASSGGGEPSAKRRRTSGGGAGGALAPLLDSGVGGVNAGGGVHSTYRTFQTQAAAFEFWDAQGPHTHLLRTFAVEHDASGRRSFIVATPERFWAEYKQLPHAQRNHCTLIWSLSRR